MPERAPRCNVERREYAYSRRDDATGPPGSGMVRKSCGCEFALLYGEHPPRHVKNIFSFVSASPIEFDLVKRKDISNPRNTIFEYDPQCHKRP
jgi:hypothetical protein